MANGGRSIKGLSGGAGTVYIQSKRSNVDHRVLLMDNTAEQGRHMPTYLNETFLKTLSFDVVNIGSKVDLRLIASNQSVKAKSISCGDASTVVIYDDVVLAAEFDKAEAQLSCSFHVSQNGEIQLPQRVELLGQDNKFDGKSFLLS